VQYLIKPPVDKEGKDVDGLWIDEQQLDVTGGFKVEREPIHPEVKTGGPQHSPTGLPHP
jgi:hypothetical protein